MFITIKTSGSNVRRITVPIDRLMLFDDRNIQSGAGGGGGGQGFYFKVVGDTSNQNYFINVQEYDRITDLLNSDREASPKPKAKEKGIV